MTPNQQAIIAAAEQAGIDPTWALAVAERESNFDPKARSSKTIKGAFQMSGPLRQQYGVGDSDDIGQQTQGWARFFGQNKYDMARVLGRQPSDEEGYLGHHFGATRAARMLKMDPNTPVDQVFTPNEMALNPHFGRAGTVGALNSSVLADVTRRHQKFQNALPDFSGEAEGSGAGAVMPMAGSAELPDLSSFGTLAGASNGAANVNTENQANFERNQKWAKPGNYNTDLGDKEAIFRKWVQDNNVPFDVTNTGPSDYDMRGFWKGAQEGDPRANTAPNPNDGLIHYDDKWKTPYHKSFSNESQWAQPNAPAWNAQDQLVDPSNGSIIYDERKMTPDAPQSGAPDLSQYGTPVS